MAEKADIFSDFQVRNVNEPPPSPEGGLIVADQQPREFQALKQLQPTQLPAVPGAAVGPTANQDVPPDDFPVPDLVDAELPFTPQALDKQVDVGDVLGPQGSSEDVFAETDSEELPFSLESFGTDDEVLDAALQPISPFGEAITKGFLGMVAANVVATSALDTLLSSLLPDSILEPGDLLESQFEDNDFSRAFFEENEFAVQFVGDLALGTASGTLAVNIAKNLGLKLFTTLQSVPGGSVLAKALFVAPAAEKAALGRKLIIAQRFSGAAGNVSRGKLATNAQSAALARRFTNLNLADALKVSAQFEIAMFTTTNSSEIVYPSELDTSTLLALTFGGALIPVAVAKISARAAIQRSKRTGAGLANKTTDPADIGKNARAGNDVALAVQADAQSIAALKELAADPSAFVTKGSKNAAEKADTLTTLLLSTQKSLKESLEQVVAKDLDELNLSIKTNASENEVLVQQAIRTLAADPTSLAGLKTVLPTRLALDARQAVDDGIVALDRQLLAAEKKLKTDPKLDPLEQAAKIDALMDKKNILNQYQFNVLNDKGEVTALASMGRTTLFGDDATGVVFSEKKSGFAGTAQIVKFTEKKDGGFPVTITIDEQLNFTGAKLKDLSLRGSSIVFAHMKKTAASYKAKGQTSIVINEDSGFLKVRMAEEILRVNPDASTDIVLTGNLGTFNSLGEGLQFVRIQRQFEEYVGLLGESGLLRAETTAEVRAAGLSEQQVAYKVDLPGGHASTNIEGAPGRNPLFGEGQSSLEQFFLNLAVQGHKTIPDNFKAGGLDSIKAFMQGRGKQLKQSNVAGFRSFSQEIDNIELPFNGSSLNSADQPTFVAITDSLSLGMATREAVIQQVAQREAITFKALSESSNPFIAEIGAVTQRQDFNIARDLNLLNDAARTGPSVFVTGRFAFRKSPLFQALNNINTRIQKFTVKHIEDVFNREFEGAAGAISYRNAISKVLGDKASQVEFGNFAAAHENAFFKSATPILGPDGRWRYPLVQEAENAEQAAFNARRWEKLFGEDLPGNANLSYLREGKVTEVAMRGDAHDLVTAFSQITSDVGRIKSELQLITSGRPIVLRNLHLPPANISGQELAFIVDINGQVVETVRELSPTMLNRELASPRVTDLIKANQGHSIVRGADVERFTTLDDNIFFGAIDAGSLTGAKQATGAISSGKLALQGERTIKNMISSLERQYNSSSLRGLNLLFEKELNRAKLLDDAFRVRDKKQTGLGILVEDTVFSAYKSQLFGLGDVNAPGTLRDINGTVETAYDRTFSLLRDKLGGNSFTDLLKKGITLSKVEAQSVIDTLGNYSPYTDTTRFIEEQLGQSVPLTLKRNQAQLSGVTTTLLLRFGDMAQNTINIVGSLVNAPAILNSLKRQAGESDIAYRERTAPFGPMIGAKEGEGFATMSPVTAMMGIVKFAQSAEGRSFIAEGRKLGYFTQQAAEVNSSLAIKSTNPVPNLLRNGMKIATFLSDKSEEMSRMYVHLLGVQVGKAAGITNRSALHTLGNQMANEAIGDFRSVNRPAVFRGAALSTFGLFQTFAQQMAQRFFGYIEDSAVKSLVIQNFMQGAFFGGKSLPGAQQLNMIIAEASGQEESLTTIADKLTGSPLGTDLLLNGFLGMIPRLFGANDSFAISGRGSADFRGFGGMNILKLDSPQFNVLNQTVRGIDAFVDQFREGGEFSVQQTAEIYSRFSVNRPTARGMEVFTGVALDKVGGVITNDMRNASSVAAAAFGLRTQRVQDQIEANFANNQLAAEQRELKTRVRDSLSPMIRAGTFKSENVVDAFHTYIRAGGQPENFVPFINNILVRAVTPKAFLQVKKFIAGKKFAELTRLVNALE